MPDHESIDPREADVTSQAEFLKNYVRASFSPISDFASLIDKDKADDAITYIANLISFDTEAKRRVLRWLNNRMNAPTVFEPETNKSPTGMSAKYSKGDIVQILRPGAFFMRTGEVKHMPYLFHDVSEIPVYAYEVDLDDQTYIFFQYDLKLYIKDTSDSVSYTPMHASVKDAYQYELSRHYHTLANGESELIGEADSMPRKLLAVHQLLDRACHIVTQAVNQGLLPLNFKFDIKHILDIDENGIWFDASYTSPNDEYIEILHMLPGWALFASDEYFQFLADEKAQRGMQENKTSAGAYNDRFIKEELNQIFATTKTSERYSMVRAVKAWADARGTDLV
jgi:hypothetical protein